MEIFAALKKKYGGRKIYVMGHAKPDRDTVLSTELFCRFGRRVGLDLCPVRTGRIGASLAAFSGRHGIDPAVWTDEVPEGADLFLVDCHAPAVPGEKRVHVIGCIDHHPTSEAPDYEIYVNLRVSSAAAEIFRQAGRENIPVSAAEEIMAVESVYADTQGTLSNKFDPSDRPWLYGAIARYGLDPEKLRGLGLNFDDLTLPPEVLAAHGVRYYTAGGVRLAVSHLTAKTVPDPDFGGVLSRTLIRRCADENVYLWLLILADTERMRTELWRVCEGAVGVTVHPGLISRSMDVVPAAEAEILDKIRRGLMKNS